MPGLPYRLGVWAYRLAVTAAAPFVPKARARTQGAATALDRLAHTPPGVDCYWMHCASVGEFEQGRTLWERLRAAQPGARFVLSFFSPSGYAHFAGRAGQVGEVVYLPWDGGSGPATFVGRLAPKLAVFVKYEWWLGYFAALRRAGVPTIVISAAFRQNQPFFRGRASNDWAVALRGIDHVFVQSAASDALVRGIGVTDCTVTGDTRLDRTLELRDRPLHHAALEAWARAQTLVLVAGSTWPRDEEMLAQVLVRRPELSLVVAPHEVGETAVRAVVGRFAALGTVVRLSRCDAAQIEPEARVVVIDSIGLLSRLYRLGQAAYVGGGFGNGIHNTLEPLVYGVPIAFGPRHARFDEAGELLAAGIAWSVSGAPELERYLGAVAEPGVRAEVFAKAAAYTRAHRGATERIWGYLTGRGLV